MPPKVFPDGVVTGPSPTIWAERCGSRDLNADYDHKNAIILGAPFDSVTDNRKFAEKLNFNCPLICGTDRAIGTAYGANADLQKVAVRVAPSENSTPTHTYPAELR